MLTSFAVAIVIGLITFVIIFGIGWMMRPTKN